MTDDEIQRLAKAVAKIVLSGLLDQTGVSFIDEQEEQDLLTELAQAMTQLDYNLQKVQWRWYCQFQI